MAPKKSTAKQKWLTVLESDSDFEVEEVKPKPKLKPKPKTKAKAKAKEIPEEDKESMEVTPGAPTSTEKGKKKTSIAPYMAEYILEKAKSGRAECKKCNTKIAKDELRIGVVVQGDRWITTNWQHVHCTIFPPTIQVVEALNGFCSLSTEHQILIRERISSSKSEVDPDDVPIDPNELVRMNWSEELEPANELLMPLLPYQKEGLGWMVNQEKSAVRGGILADEMGMGKTIQAIGLILANRPDPRNAVQQKLRLQTEQDHMQLMSNAPPESSVITVKCPAKPKGRNQQSKMSRGQTLVVVPTVALRQWQSEILRFTKEGHLSISVYHGNSRGQLTQRMLMGADIVLTTFKILEVEFRKATAHSKMPCSLCGKKYYPDKYRIHRKYFCGADSKKTFAQSKTQRKGRGGWGAMSQKEVISVDSESSEDEIDRQKKMIKDMKAKEVTKTSKSSTSKNAKPVKGKAINKRNIRDDGGDDSSSEDEIDRQKRLIKEMKEKKEKKNAKSSRDKKVPDEGSSNRRVTKKMRPATATAALTKKKLTEDSDYSGNSEDMDDSSEESSYSGPDATVVAKKRKRGGTKTVISKRNPTSKDAKGKGKGGQTSVKKIVADRDSDSGTDESSSDSDGWNPEVEKEIAAALKRSSKDVVPSLLHAISWFRIILDEAHLIKDRSSSTAKAVFQLTSLNKWCLTGTPLQNRVGELFSLVRFLRLDPHSFYYCRAKDCKCKSLHYKFTKGRCDECSHTAMQHFSHFNKHILNPIKRMGYVGEGRKGMLTLKNEILDEVLLRRTKDTRADDIQLPPRIVKVRMDALDPFEEDFYEAMYTQSQAQFNTYVDAGTILNNYAHIFDILIRLRQVVDHPYLVLHSNTKSTTVGGVSYGDNGVPKTLAEMNTGVGAEEGEVYVGGRRRSSRLGAGEVCGDFTTGDDTGDDIGQLCGFCHEPPVSPVHAHCTHIFCESCVTDYLQLLESNEDTSLNSTAMCPQCSEALSLVFSKEIAATSRAECETYLPRSEYMSARERKNFVNRLDLTNFQSSTKLEALMQELHMMRERDYGAKAIVFSQFVNMLDLTEYRLQRGGYKCGKLTGSLNVDQRDKIIQSFNTDPDMNVLLISLKAGGVALNLTAANHIFIMDPWWNPAAEMQAIDRTHRIGQHKPIHATRFIVENTIEERILHLQEKKRLVFDGTIGGDAGSMARLNVEDMRFLFQ